MPIVERLGTVHSAKHITSKADLESKAPHIFPPPSACNFSQSLPQTQTSSTFEDSEQQATLISDMAPEQYSHSNSEQPRTWRENFDSHMRSNSEEPPAWKKKYMAEMKAYECKILERSAEDAWHSASFAVKRAKISFKHMHSTFDEISQKVFVDNIENLEKQASEKLWNYYEKRERRMKADVLVNPDLEPELQQFYQFLASERAKQREQQKQSEQARYNTQEQSTSSSDYTKAPTFPQATATGPKATWFTWSNACTEFFKYHKAPFPKLPSKACSKPRCLKGEKIGGCIHVLQWVLQGSGQYTELWLRRERVRWHPDRFSGRVEYREHAQELFQMIQSLVDDFASERD